MKKSRSGLWVGLLVFFVAAIYSGILFLAKPTFDPAAWVLYGATLVAFLLMGLQMVASSQKGSAVITDTALGVVTTAYFGLQLLFGGIVCMFFADLPLTPVVIGELVLLGIYLVIAFLMFAAQSSNEAQTAHDQSAVRQLRLWENDVQGMADRQTDPAKQRALQELSEAIHYSDHASLPTLDDIDGRIARSIAILQDELTDGSADPLARISAIQRLLKERDRTAAIRKR